jgi:hypothetical protein
MLHCHSLLMLHRGGQFAFALVAKWVWRLLFLGFVAF